MVEGLNILEQGNTSSPLQVEFRHITDFLPSDATDEQVIEEVGKHQGILVTYDKGFKTIKLRYQLYKQHDIGVIFFHSFKDVIRYWDFVVSFIIKWEKLKQHIVSLHKPFAVEISITGFRDLPFK
jgi:hypothetical protein